MTATRPGVGAAARGTRPSERKQIMARRAMKPNKAIAKRFKVSKNGKLKGHHGFTSHLMSSRSAKRRRKLRQSSIVPEMHADRLRRLMGVFKSPGKVATAKARRARAAKAAAVVAEPVAA